MLPATVGLFCVCWREECGTESWPWKRYSSANVCCFVGVDQGEDEDIDPGDDLLFWRLYGNECRGVSIAMASHLSEKLVKSLVVQRVVYTDEPRMRVDVAAIAAVLGDLDGLRVRAFEADLWPQICQVVVPVCDFLLGQRFLCKRSHYEMEREYRALAFVTQDGNDAPEDFGYSSRGLHVQYGRIRTYVQILDLSCESILTTGSQVTIGNNVPKSRDAKGRVARLVEGLGRAPNVVGTRVSGIRYRPR